MICRVGRVRYTREELEHLLHIPTGCVVDVASTQVVTSVADPYIEFVVRGNALPETEGNSEIEIGRFSCWQSGIHQLCGEQQLQGDHLTSEQYVARERRRAEEFRK